MKTPMKVTNYTLNTFLATACMLIFFSSCGFDRYNAVTDDTPDVQEGSEYVYGEGPDAPPRQTKNEYANTPESEKQAIEIRKKMFGEQQTTPAPAPMPAAPAADSTQADSAAVE